MASITAHVAVLLLLALAGMVEAQLNCAEAPTEALQIQCEQIQKWDTSIREAAEKQANAPKLPPGFDTGSLVGSGMGLDIVPTNLQHCVDLSCACNYLQGTLSGDTCNLASGGVFKKIVRKEYRVMTDEERGRFHGVLNALQATQDFKDLQKIHSQTGSSGSAHSGPAFLPWHREYIKRLEFIIRRQDPTLFLPYWDSTLDTALPKPADSIMFTDNFLGTTDADGNIVTGPFAEWRTLNTNKQVRRKVGAQGAPFTNENIQSVLQQTAIEQVLAFTAPQAGCSFKPNWNVLEYTHGNVHIFIGGDMLDQSTSSNDPAFFLHHCFVDLIWELWRQAAQNRDQRETDYPADNQACSGTQHFKNAIMKPFAPMQNDDGLLNSYTDQLYEYAPRPTCPDCGGSAYLFCDTSHGAPRCGAKAKIGGACNGFTNGEDVCYGGVCDGSVCAPAPEPTPPPTTPPPIIITTPPPAVTEDCFNEAPCCSYWAGTGECSKNKAYMEQWCKVSCGVCTPKAYDPNAECNDRHINCATWSASGECDKNPSWMGENCRQSCKLCGKTRAEQCTPGQAVTEAPVEHCDSPGCYNEFECCSTWADEGECRSNATFMSCNCRVSCGICSPTDYKYGGCNDFHKDCPAWAAGGQCQLNPWMLENCRASCRNCQDQRTLRSRCSRTRSSGRGGSRNGAFGGFGGFGGRRGFHGGGGFGGGGWGWG